MLTKFPIIMLQAILALLVSGCSFLPPSVVGVRSQVDLTSIDGHAALSPRLSTRLYRFVDENTADIILTDLSLEDLTDESSPPATGQIVHVELFIRPKPGRTPIEQTACSAAVRYGVLARGEAGIYAGAGFMVPEVEPGGKLFGGSMKNAPVRLVRATDLFVDQLGPAQADISLTATRDDDAVSRWISILDRISVVSKQVTSADQSLETVTAHSTEADSP